MTHAIDSPRIFTRPVRKYLELPDGSWIATEGILWRIADEYAHVVTFDKDHFTDGQWSFPHEMIAWYTEQGIFKRDIQGMYLDEEAFKQLAMVAIRK